MTSFSKQSCGAPNKDDTDPTSFILAETLELTQESANHEERPSEVDVNRLLPLRQAHLIDRNILEGDVSVIDDEDLNWLAVLLVRLDEQTVDFVLGSNIGTSDSDPTVVGVDFTQGLWIRIIMSGDERVLVEEGVDGAHADATAASCDQDVSIFESEIEHNGGGYCDVGGWYMTGCRCSNSNVNIYSSDVVISSLFQLIVHDQYTVNSL